MCVVIFSLAQIPLHTSTAKKGPFVDLSSKRFSIFFEWNTHVEYRRQEKITEWSSVTEIANTGTIARAYRWTTINVIICRPQRIRGYAPCVEGSIFFCLTVLMPLTYSTSIFRKTFPHQSWLWGGSFMQDYSVLMFSVFIQHLQESWCHLCGMNC